MALSQVKNQVHRYQLLSRNPLTSDEADLYELTHMAGIVMDPNVFKIILDLQKLTVRPMAIDQILKSMVSHHLRNQSGDATENVNNSSSSATTKGRASKTKNIPTRKK